MRSVDLHIINHNQIQVPISIRCADSIGKGLIFPIMFGGCGVKSSGSEGITVGNHTYWQDFNIAEEVIQRLK